MPIRPLGAARLRLEAAAQALNVSAAALEDLERRGKLPGSLRQGASLVFIDIDEARAAVVELRRIRGGLGHDADGRSRVYA